MKPTFEGPLPGGNLPECVVLRCTTESSYLVRVSDEHGPLGSVERMICEEHKIAIEGGAPYRWDPEQFVMLMGADRAGDGRFVATSVSVSETWMDQDSALGAATVFKFTNEAGKTLEVAISQETADSLGEYLGSSPR